MAITHQHYPRYRVLTGPDDDAFCYRISEALEMGYVLHGSPSVTFGGKSVIVAQAVVWPSSAIPLMRRPLAGE